MKIITQEQPKLFQTSKSASFFDISPRDPCGLKKAANRIKERSYPREELSHILLEYNRAIGNDSLALQNIRRLAEPESQCVITGQQLGFMSGPFYTILKGISCVQLSQEAKAIPIFWLATEDHDIAEIDHTFLIDSLGNLKKFHLSLPKGGTAVEDLKLFSSHFEVIDQFFKEVKAPHLFSNMLKKPASYAKWMAQFLVQMFAGTGLVFVEPYLLRSLARPFFKREVLENSPIQQILYKTSIKMKEAGLAPPLEVGKGTNLFIKTADNHRNKLRWEDAKFIANTQTFSESELIGIIDQEPERFSTNVAARPVLQSLLFPTLSYVAGPSELSYFQQLGDYHHYYGINMPWIIPRISATFLTVYSQELLKQCGLFPWDPLPAKGEAAHYLKNYLHPHGKLQERVLNWWQFQAGSLENLIGKMITQSDWHSEGHLYCYLDI
jgi:bacillithiol biosynthesis cysteine-adding enzyme BshC